MKVIFLGVGEAFDEREPNTSILISSLKTKLLLDCGFSAAQQVWTYNSDDSFLDAIFISHLHADHYFGLSPLLMRMKESERKKALTIICQKGNKDKILEILESGYLGLIKNPNHSKLEGIFKPQTGNKLQGFTPSSSIKKIKFPIHFVEVNPEHKIQFNELELSFAQTEHSIPNLAISINDKKKKVCYSGDGMFTKESEKLYENSDLLIHEAYLPNGKEEGHAEVEKLFEMSKSKKVKCLALVHLRRTFRQDFDKQMKSIIARVQEDTIIPRAFDEYSP